MSTFEQEESRLHVRCVCGCGSKYVSAQTYFEITAGEQRERTGGREPLLNPGSVVYCSTCNERIRQPGTTLDRYGQVVTPTAR